MMLRWTVYLGMLGVCFAGDVVSPPLKTGDGKTGWRRLVYSKIPPNEVKGGEKGLVIKVKNSACPLIYRFNQTATARRVRIKGVLDGLPKIPAGKRQGDKGADDFPLRLGLVLSGKRRLGRFEGLIAAKWVKELYKLAGSSGGIDHVLFLDLASPPAPKWKSRVHPASKGLFKERVVGTIDKAGAFELDVNLKGAKEVIALWLSSDGDDTKSTFTVTIKSIELFPSTRK